MVKPKQRNDNRPFAVLVITLVILLGGVLLSFVPDSWVIGDNKDYSENATIPSYMQVKQRQSTEGQTTNVALAKLDPTEHSQQQQELLNQQQFADAAKLLQIGHFQQAITLLHKVLARHPNLPEAHTNLGFAMLGLGELKKAVKSFNYALTIRAEEANAYYGLALVAEQEGDYDIAMGAMRSYLHLRKDDTYVAKARAALAYWQSEQESQDKK
ncbi:tetratricopeptide repeat protein [Thalassotalea sp. G2M2-11]|uniref:tetratricopeptide repeat protein n=1 Tax=Thalassotalea sp. G2M2-11 TaxID=2787627 RepID=UPI0019D1F0E0|nr:tetratricopeptide repeat protein [Thalassotalea sp. G2M2-11]